MLILRNVEILQWRRIQPGTRIVPGAGVNLVLGGVATGKSTLLTLCAMALRSDFSTIASEDHDLSYDIEYVDLGATCTMRVHRRWQVEPAALSLGVDITVADKLYSCSLQGPEIRMEHEGRVLASHQLQIEDDLEPLSWALIAIAGSGEAELMASIGMVGALMRCHHRTVRVDEGLDVFRAVLGTAGAGYPAATLHMRYPLPQAKLARLESSVPGFASVQLGYQVHVRLWRDPELTTIVLNHDELPFFERLVRMFGCHSLQFSTRRVHSTPVEGGAIYQYGAFRFAVRFAEGQEPVSERELSYGQKRLLGLLYCLDADPDHFIADGVTHGLPGEWLTDLFGNLSTTCQAFVTGDAPSLLAHATQVADGAPRSVIGCTREGEGALVWRVLESAQVTQLERAHDQGAAQLAAALAARGLA